MWSSAMACCKTYSADQSGKTGGFTEIMRIAASNTLLCRMRIDDDLVWTLLTNHGKGGNDSVNRLHANILMAGRYQEAA